MKLRFLLLIIVCAIQCGMLEAKERQITVDISEWEKLERSLSNAPTLYHDGNTIYIHSDLPLQNMEVTVSGVSGCIVYEGVLSVGMDQTISFTFDRVGDEEYMIEISHGRKYLYGWFELD